jgi:cellobiose phosphorylase
MHYGHFDDKRREYVIERPDTPLPWINYLGCEDYLGIITNTAGGYSFYGDARLRRITRYRYNNVPLDFGGRYLYLRDGEAGAYWSPSWQPTRSPLDAYSCRHGLGYTIIASSHQGIDAETRYFVPLGDDLEIWQLTLTNRRDEPAQLSVFSAIEFALWDAEGDTTNLQRNLNVGEVEIEDGVIYHKTEYRERRDHFAYFACSGKVVGFDTQRRAFLGPYRSWESPLAVEEGRSFNSTAVGWAPIGSHQVSVALEPGESKQIVFLLGYHENPSDEKFDPPRSQTINKRTVKPLIAKFLDPENADAAFEKLGEHWDVHLGTLQVETPDEHTNRMVNIWNAYQCMVTFNVARSASLFETGVGRGIGFRDSNQDLLASVQMVPQRARQRILDLAATQLQTGGAYHQYQPLTKRGNDEIGDGFSDDPLWLVLSAAAYIKETGDWSILDEPVPYDTTPGTEEPLYDHLRRAIEYTLDRLGPHRLPLVGRADWNDCLNLNTFSSEPGDSFQTAPLGKAGDVAESVFIAGLFVKAGGELAAIARRRGLEEEAKRYEDEVEKMSRTVLEHGWDGDWFLRAYDANGHKVGSHECDEGQVFIEPQGMCTMARIGVDSGHAAKALAAVRKRLATPHGIVLHQPAFTRYYLHLGEISSYPPGYKENGSVFCHTNPWVMIAEAILGSGDRAHDYYTRINPSAREEISEVHGCEPYVYAQMIAGPDAAVPGEAKNSWLTGAAAWAYVAITQWILGIRPTHKGLEICPVIPKDWAGFHARRVYRGVTYSISVERKGKGDGVSVSVDGAAIEGTLLPAPPAGQTEVKVEVKLG